MIRLDSLFKANTGPWLEILRSVAVRAGVPNAERGRFDRVMRDVGGYEYCDVDQLVGLLTAAELTALGRLWGVSGRTKAAQLDALIAAHARWRCGAPSAPRAAGPAVDPWIYDSAASGESRGYQIEAVQKIGNYLSRWKPGQPPKLLHVATGGGKTRIANDAIWKRVQQGQRFIWLAKDWELVRQASADLCRRYPDAWSKIAVFGNPKDAPRELARTAEAAILYSTLQSFHTAYDKLELPSNDPFAIVIDECHWGDGGLMAMSVQEYAYRRMPILGLTATPKRPEEGGTFRVLYSKTFAELVEDGYLARPVVGLPVRTGVAWTTVNIPSGGDDFTAESLRELGQSAPRNSVVVDTVARLAREQKLGPTIVFACNIAHAIQLTTDLNRKGLPTTVVHSDMAPVERRAAIDDIRRGSKQVIVNVDILATGVDIPEIRTLVMARPTASATRFAQMVGRGARRVPGKDTFAIIEFTDNCARHGDRLVRADQVFEASTATPVAPQSRPTSASTSPRVYPRHRYDPTGDARLLVPTADRPIELHHLWIRDGQTFGVEIELTSDAYKPRMSDQAWSTAAGAIHRALVAALGAGRVGAQPYRAASSPEAEPYATWQVLEDTSAGWEVTSPILCDEEGLRELQTAMAALERDLAPELGLRVNYRTGLHVHHGWLSDDFAAVRRFVRLVRFLEPQLATLVSPSRVVRYEPATDRYNRAEVNQYCQPISRMLPGRVLVDAKNLDELLAPLDDRDRRYATVNLVPTFAHNARAAGTVEVRWHNGTLNFADVALWISLWQMLLHMAADSANEAVVSDVADRPLLRPARGLVPWLDLNGPSRGQSIHAEFLARLQRRVDAVRGLWAKHPDLADQTW